MGVALRRLGVKGIEVRKAELPEKVPSFIIPGGESTTVTKLAHYHNLFPALCEFVWMGKPMWGTCARLIFLANKADRRKVDSNSWVALIVKCVGTSSVVSSEACLSVTELASKEGGPETFRGVFIRAPSVLEACPEVEVLAEYLASSEKEGGHCSEKVIVAVRQVNLLGTAFHPELTADSRCHSYFLKMAREVEEGTSNSIVTITSSTLLSLLVNERAVNDLPIFE